MVTRADTLAHLVDSFSEPGDQDAHNPALPLVLGDITINKYSTFTYDPIAGAYRIVVVDGTSNSTLTFDSDGTLLLNGQSIADSEEFQQLLQQAQLAAQQAQAAAVAAGTSETNAGNSATAALEASTTANDAALLSAAYASAPDDVQLPGGGKSAAVSATIAASIAQESRALDQAGPVTASEVFQAGFFDTERRVTTTTPITITLPQGLYTSSAPLSKWAAYKLCAASGSVTAVAGGGTGFSAPSIAFNQHAHFRIANSIATLRNTLSTTLVAVPAVTSGALYFVFYSMHNSTDTLTDAIPTVTGIAGSPAIQVLRALPATGAGLAVPDCAVYKVPLTAFAGGNIVISVDNGVYVWYQSLDAWVIDGIGPGANPVVVSTNTGSAAQFNATQTGLAAQTLVLASAMQAAESDTAGMGFSNFTTNLTKVQNGNSYGSPNVLVNDANIRQNGSWAFGNGTVNSAGNFAMSANFSTATASGKFTTIAIPPSESGGSVAINAEAGRMALTVPYGVMEIWAQPDGNTYEIRTSKP